MQGNVTFGYSTNVYMYQNCKHYVRSNNPLFLVETNDRESKSHTLSISKLPELF